MSVRKICTWIIGSGWIKRGHDIGHLVLTLLPLLVSLHPMSDHRLRGEIEGGHLRRFPSGRRGKGERPKERAGKKGHFRVCSYYYMHSTFARVVSFPGHGPRRHGLLPAGKFSGGSAWAELHRRRQREAAKSRADEDCYHDSARRHAESLHASGEGDPPPACRGGGGRGDSLHYHAVSLRECARASSSSSSSHHGYSADS